MQLHKLIEELSDQEQEVVAGGYTVEGSGFWGSFKKIVDGASGSYTFTSPDGSKHTASWSPSGFSYS